MESYSGERSVLARFPSGEGAGKAAGELKAAGYHTVQVGRISHYGSPAESTSPYPGGGEVGMTIFSSGGGDSLYGGPAGAEAAVAAGGDSFLVTVVTDEGSAAQVRDILKKYGGSV